MKLKEILSSYLTFYFYFLYDPFNKINLGIMVLKKLFLIIFLFFKKKK